MSQSGTSGVYLCRKSRNMCFSNIDIKKNKERCLELLRSTGREGMEDMIIELEKMGYFSMSSFQSLSLAVGDLNGGIVLWEL